MVGVLLSELSLTALGIEPDTTDRAVEYFRYQDEKNLLAVHEVYADEQQLI